MSYEVDRLSSALNCLSPQGRALERLKWEQFIDEQRTINEIHRVTCEVEGRMQRGYIEDLFNAFRIGR